MKKQPREKQIVDDESKSSVKTESNGDPGSFVRFKIRDVLVLALLSVAYIFISARLIGSQPEQFILIVLYNGLYFASPITRKMILGFSVFAVYWIIFDYMKAFPNYKFNPVHIQGLYDLEKTVFGIRIDQIVVTANEYWLDHTRSSLDLLSGFFYLCWIPVPLLFGVFLFFKDRAQFLKFSLTFLLINFIGFVIYYSYPAAPPWYFREFGTIFYPETPGGIAGLARFDNFFHLGIFQSIYSKSSNVFAAMPSLHSAYPLVVFYFGLRSRLGLINILTGAVTAGIWFAAIYTSHHYILDVLVGIACAGIGIALFNWLVSFGSLKKLFNQYLSAIQ